MVTDTLGTETKTVPKIGFFIFTAVTLVFLGYQYIEVLATTGPLNSLTFYLFFGTIGLIMLAFEMAVKNDKPLDTVTIEEDAPVKLSLKNQFILGAVLSILVTVWIATTQTAFVQAPKFQFLETSFGSALFSALAGGAIETLVFFVFLMPTIYAGVYKRTNSQVLSAIAAILGGAVIFLFFHTKVYEYNQSALFTVFIFGLVNSSFVYIFRSNLMNMMIHFTNNFAVTFFSIAVFGIAL